MNETEYKTFLNNFPLLKRSLIMNQFLAAIREGKATSVNELLNWVYQDTVKRRASRWGDDASRELQIDLSSRLLSDEAARLAEYCLWYESLPREAREKLKQGKGEEYQKQWMAKQPPTPKQLEYLKGLGCQDVPGNRLEASLWIDKLVK